MLMRTIKKIGVLITSFVLLLVTVFAFSTLLQNSKKVAKAASTDFTQFSRFEQDELNKQISLKWGTPTSLKKLNNNFTSLAGTEDAWYYLTSDIQANITETIGDTSQARHVRILLNGYTISGIFDVTVKNGSTLSIFDKIPDKTTGLEYQYNPTPEKHYAFNTATNAYTDCSVRMPAGQDVTEAPSFKENTFIKTTGSAFSPSVADATTATTSLKADTAGYINVYGINMIGVKTISIVIATNGGQVDLEQCMIVGNALEGSGAIRLMEGDASILYLRGNKIYGNSTINPQAGVSPANEELSRSTADLNIKKGSMSIYKNKIGSVVNDTYTKALYMQNTNFNQQVTLTEATLMNALYNLNNIEGSLELIYGITLEYTGISPNLHLIVHGTNTTANLPNAQLNVVKITTNAEVGNITTIHDAVSMTPITIAGKAHGLSTTASAIVESTATVTVQQNQTVNRVKNDGVMNVYGTILAVDETGSVNGIFTVYKTGEVTFGSGAVLATIVSEGTVNIDDAVTVDKFTLNGGKVNLKGTLTAPVLNAGEIVIIGANAVLPSDIVLEKPITLTVSENSTFNTAFSSLGTVNIQLGARAENLKLNGATLNLYGSVGAISYESGLVNVLANTAKLPDNTINPTTGKMVIANGITATFSIFNDGQLIVNESAIVEHVKNLENGTIHVEGEILILEFVGGSVTVATSTAELPKTVEIPVNGTLTILDGVTCNTNFLNYGTLNINKGVVASNVINYGTTIVDENAKLTSLLVNAGYVDVRNNATIKNAQLQADGKLEIAVKAKVENLTYKKSVGVLIDHRAEFRFILIVSITSGGVFLLLILTTVLLIIFGKKKKRQRAAGALGRFEDRLQRNSCINKKKLAVSRYENVKNITLSKTQSVIGKSKSKKKKK